MFKELIKKIKEARFVFVCGNGGSASTAEHLTNDLFSRGIKAICLNSNTSIITMIGNDFSYSDIFSRQLSLYATKEDLLITISCSGTSKNILKAIAAAKKVKMPYFSFPTFKRERNYEKFENQHLVMVHKIKRSL